MEKENEQPATELTPAEKKREYMRRYMAKRYLQKGEQVRSANRMYYVKYKDKLSGEETKKYGLLLPSVRVLQKELAHINQQNPELLISILEQFQFHYIPTPTPI